jgi:hypothetical protein
VILSSILPSAQQLNGLVHLQQRLRLVQSPAELCFVLANESAQLFSYQQALVWTVDSQAKPALKVVSGLAVLGEDSPFTAWLRLIAPQMLKRLKQDGEYFQASDFAQTDQANWQEWVGAFLLTFRLFNAEGATVGMVAFAVDEALDEVTQEMLGHLVDTAGHSWGRLLQPKGRVASNAKGSSAATFSSHLKRQWKWWLFAAACLLLFLPVRLSVVAPAEVIALDAQVLTAPLDGVIKTVHVRPNQGVTKGQVLFSLDDTTLRNRKEVANKQMAIAKVDSQSAQQKAIGTEATRQELATLQGRVAERTAEIAAISEQLERLDIRSPGDGVVIFGDINDWLGKPVITGERIAQLADPNDAGVLIWLPVAEAINLEEGAQLRVFLQVAPLSALDAKVIQTSYQSVLSPEGIASYRLRAQLIDSVSTDKKNNTKDAKQIARVGLKGTAKLYGDRAPLALYLFRRPLSTLRELFGW